MRASKHFMALASASLVASVVGVPTVDTTPGVTTYYSRCGSYPSIDPGVDVSTTLALITSGVVTITTGAVATDVLEIDPDPLEECSWLTGTCGPCPPLALTTVSPTHLLLTGGAASSVYERCMRRVHWRSTAFGGEEGLGDRVVSFGASDTSGGAADTKTIAVVAEDDDACSERITRNRVEVSWPPDGRDYGLGCTACDPNILLIAQGLSITMPTFANQSEPNMQWARLLFNRFTPATPPAVFDDEHDRAWVVPDPDDPRATWDNPCPGLTLHNTTDASDLYSGFNVTGFMPPSLYTRCLRRTYYTNTAAAAADTLLGSRSIEIRAIGPVTATGSQFMAITQRLVVVDGCPDGCDTIPGPTPGPGTGLKTVITWYGAAGCPSTITASHRSLVIAREGVCHRVADDDAVVRASYIVDCIPTATGYSGTVSFCEDTSCGDCTTVVPWTNKQCLANDPVYGSSSYSVQCNPTAINAVPRADDFMAEWYAGPNCVASGGANETRTIVVGPKDVCHVVPVQSAITPGASVAYNVECNAAGTAGVFSVCTAGCGSCSTRTPFVNGACLANPSQTGSSSVRFLCSSESLLGSGAETTSATVALAALGLLLAVQVLRE